MKKKIQPKDFLRDAILRADTCRRDKEFTTAHRLANATAELEALKVLVDFHELSNVEEKQFAKNFLTSLMRDCDALRVHSVPEFKARWISLESQVIALLLRLEDEK